jgi:hypothetical protein
MPTQSSANGDFNLSEKQPTIKLRIDVDYPYPSSRAKSFLYIALGIKSHKGKGYLENARVIAKMVNDSPKKVKAYWFFTPYTIPDQELLNLLNPERHEVGLHVATNAEKEYKTLQQKTGRTIQYYTFHGTRNAVAQILWKRKLGQKQATVPNAFPLKSFHDFPTTSLDTRASQTWLPYSIVEEAQKWISEGTVISIHPEWLFAQNKKGSRGRYYEMLKAILEVP